MTRFELEEFLLETISEMQSYFLNSRGADYEAKMRKRVLYYWENMEDFITDEKWRLDNVEKDNKDE